MKRLIITSSLSLLLVQGVVAQRVSDEGISLGPVLITTEIEVGAAYDSRIIRGTGGDSLEDSYSEAEAGILIQNRPARYNLSASARYGYRFYSTYSEIDDDFYTLSASLKRKGEDSLQWEVSADLNKSLTYRTDYNPSTGQGVDLVLTNVPNQRVLAEGFVGYDRTVTDKISIFPQYSFLYYKQRLEDEGQTEIAEWQVHSSSLALRYKYSEKTVFALEGIYRLQENREENGEIGTVYAALEREVSEKTAWRLRLGISSAEYDTSGSDVQGVSDFWMRWRSSEKVELYAFGGNAYQPGYGGGSARMEYRAGYGLDWYASERLLFGGRGLHTYDEELNAGPASDGESKQIYDITCRYYLVNHVEMGFGIEYTRDELDEDRLVAALKIGYSR